MSRYRYRTGEKVGRWCDTKRDAMLAAVKAGLGSVDKRDGGPYTDPPIYLHPLVKIEQGPEA